ncbi:MAG: TA system VapC family ribonuclease toxin [Deltaproteobacteria bacterium]|nr:TA system VapC family ribonuclease toxin [Deltaproteobacteria bacterium]
MRHLLDVNVWVALLDEAHVHHALALAFIEKPSLRIATCPLVENGVVRVLNLPGYSVYGPVGFERVRSKLNEICAAYDHEFWPDSVSLRDERVFNWSRISGHNQITDAYILALAVAHDGCLVTLDHRVALSTVIPASSKNLLLL